MDNREQRRLELSPREDRGPVRGVALLLPGGTVRSHRRPLRIAERAREVVPVCRLEVAGANHYMMSRAADFWSVTAEFVLDTLAGRDPAPLLAEALAAPDGLRTPVPVGYPGRG